MVKVFLHFKTTEDTQTLLESSKRARTNQILYYPNTTVFVPAKQVVQ